MNNTPFNDEIIDDNDDICMNDLYFKNMSIEDMTKLIRKLQSESDEIQLRNKYPTLLSALIYLLTVDKMNSEHTVISKLMRMYEIDDKLIRRGKSILKTFSDNVNYESLIEDDSNEPILIIAIAELKQEIDEFIMTVLNIKESNKINDTRYNEIISLLDHTNVKICMLKRDLMNLQGNMKKSNVTIPTASISATLPSRSPMIVKVEPKKDAIEKVTLISTPSLNDLSSTPSLYDGLTQKLEVNEDCIASLMNAIKLSSPTVLYSKEQAKKDDLIKAVQGKQNVTLLFSFSDLIVGVHLNGEIVIDKPMQMNQSSFLFIIEKKSMLNIIRPLPNTNATVLISSDENWVTVSNAFTIKSEKFGTAFKTTNVVVSFLQSFTTSYSIQKALPVKLEWKYKITMAKAIQWF